MRKGIMLMGLLLLAVVANAENTMVASLLDHVGTVTQFRSGETRLALVDSVVQIGSVGGKSIVDLQLGFNGATKPEAGEVQSANFVAGACLKIRQGVHYSDDWKFLNAVEHGPYLSYDFRRGGWYGGYQFGLAFSLNPQQ